MLTKSKASGASRKAGSIYVEVEFAPGRAAWVRVIKSDLWRALKDYPGDGEISGTIDANGDVWIGPSQLNNNAGSNSNRSFSNDKNLDVLFNKLDKLERMVTGKVEQREEGGKREKRPSRLMGREPVQNRGPKEKGGE